MIKRISILIFMLVVSSSIFAIPYTTLGEMKVPTAYVMPSNMFGISYVSYMSAKPFEDQEHDYALALNYGAFDWIELSAILNGKAGFTSNVKVRILDERNNIPAIAFGVDNLFSEIEEDDFKAVDYTEPTDYTANSLYFVLSKTTILRGLPFFEVIETTMNFGMGNKRFKGSSDVSKQLGGAFIALEFKPHRAFALLGELDGFNINIGAKFIYNNLIIRGGMYRFEENSVEGYKPRFALNVKYTFDLFSKVTFSDWMPKPQRPEYSNTPVVMSSKINNAQQSGDPLEQLQKEKAEERKRLQKELEDLLKEINED